MFALQQLTVKIILQRSVLPKVLEVCIRAIFNGKSLRNGTIHRHNEITLITTSAEKFVRVVAVPVALRLIAAHAS